VTSLARLFQHHVPGGGAAAAAILLGLATAGCDDAGPATLVSHASFTTTAIVSPSPIVLAPIVNVPCAAGVGFDSSFHLVVTAGTHALTLDSVTIHMIDGTNLGPSITIPRPELAPPVGTTLIPAGATRDFLLRPSFGCVVNTPQSFRATAVLLDTRGSRQTLAVSGGVR
jgi:hypothetical protein